jgi:hypothetical protein
VLRFLRIDWGHGKTDVSNRSLVPHAPLLPLQVPITMYFSAFAMKNVLIVAADCVSCFPELHAYSRSRSRHSSAMLAKRNTTRKLVRRRTSTTPPGACRYVFEAYTSAITSLGSAAADCEQILAVPKIKVVSNITLPCFHDNTIRHTITLPFIYPLAPTSAACTLSTVVLPNPSLA